jgi:hypothetical protein
MYPGLFMFICRAFPKTNRALGKPLYPKNNGGLMMKKKILEVLSAVAVLVLLFSGCPQTPGNGGGGGDDLVLSIDRVDSDDSNFVFTTGKEKDSSITYKV